MFTITLNNEMSAVLLRCLASGQSCVSQSEHDSGVAEVIRSNIELIRFQVCNKLSNQIIKTGAGIDLEE